MLQIQLPYLISPHVHVPETENLLEKVPFWITTRNLEQSDYTAKSTFEN
jgi:hypothetical protein